MKNILEIREENNITWIASSSPTLWHRMPRHFGILCSAFLLSVTTVPCLSAQSDFATTRLATITTDTGAFAPGHRDFSRYTALDLCRAAVHWTDRVARGTLAGQADSLRRMATRDTLGTSGTAAVARACDARFPVRTTIGVPELALQLGLALQAQDLSHAQAVVARVVTDYPQQAEDFRLRAIATSLDSVTPANVMAAATFVAQVDALGTSAVADQIAAHHLLLDFWQRVDDTLKVRQEAVHILTLADSALPSELGPHERQLIHTAYGQLLRLVWWTTPDSVSAVAQRACRDLNRLARTWSQDCAHPTDAERDQVLADLMPWLRSLYKTPAPPMTADFWFSPVHDDTMGPLPGTVTLVVAEDFNSPFNIADPEHAWWEWSARHITEHLRHWLVTYHPQGLRVTVAAATHGSALFHGTMPPAAEADVIRHFVQDVEQLPVTVAVRTTPVQFRPLPDGRQVDATDDTLYGRNALYYQHEGNYRTPYVLIDRDGTVLMQTDNPDLIEDGLRKVFAAHRAASGLRSPTPNFANHAETCSVVLSHSVSCTTSRVTSPSP